MDSLPLNPSTHLLLPHFSSKALVNPLPCHGSLQCSIHRCRQKEDPAIEEAPPAKVMSCALVTSTNLEKTLDAAKEVTGGAGVPSAKMVADRPTPLAGRPWLVANRSPVMRADHHQHAKVPPISEVVECIWLVLSPLV
jgi:hypothetical protein